LHYPEATFDIVNARFLAGGITDWFNFIRDVRRVLSATGNGSVQFTELRPALRSDDNIVLATAPSASWPNIFFSEGEICNRLGTARIDEIATMLKARCEATGFIDVHEYIDKIPVGSWHPSPSL
jgi:hypothetical protein